MNVFDWYADTIDPPAFQLDVLAWLERIGVPAPAVEQYVTDVFIARDGEGAQVVVNKYVLPLTVTAARQELRFPLSELPPARPC